MGIVLSESEKKQYIEYINLLACVINGGEVPELSDDFDWNFVCRNAQRNSVANIIAYTFDKVNVKPPKTAAAVMENERRYQILKETSQLIDIERVIEGFEKEKIKNIPLKGYFMKNYYPRSDLRSMSDVDIFVEKKNLKKAEKVFLSQEFEKVDVINATESHFRKGLLYVEVHCDLNENDDFYYNDVLKKVKLREGYSYSFEFSYEDFYVYLIYHAAKHFSRGGIGIRMVMDIYVYLSRFKELDSGYIEAQLKELGLLSFEKNLRELSLNWFSEDETVIDDLGQFILYCSTFGKLDVFFYQDNKRTARFYWLMQFFKPYRTMRQKYGYLKKFPFLLPFSWGQYWFTRLFVRRDINYKTGFSERVVKLEQEDRTLINNLTDKLEIN